MKTNHPINCRECGRVLFKADEAFRKEESSILILCKCGSAQQITTVKEYQIKIETVKKGVRVVHSSDT